LLERERFSLDRRVKFIRERRIREREVFIREEG
jgi:hypothetical protein